MFLNNQCEDYLNIEFVNLFEKLILIILEKYFYGNIRY
jgi:hypothetical protein